MVNFKEIFVSCIEKDKESSISAEVVFFSILEEDNGIVLNDIIFLLSVVNVKKVMFPKHV